MASGNLENRYKVMKDKLAAISKYKSLIGDYK